jgi:hypothetical protein
MLFEKAGYQTEPKMELTRSGWKSILKKALLKGFIICKQRNIKMLMIIGGTEDRECLENLHKSKIMLKSKSYTSSQFWFKVRTKYSIFSSV